MNPFDVILCIGARLQLQNDRTNGCIAVTNEEMDIIRDKVRDGNPIEIRNR